MTLTLPVEMYRLLVSPKHCRAKRLRDKSSILRREATEPHYRRFPWSSDYGQKYLVRGILEGPSERSAEVVTVWIILSGEVVPRFVTAFPGGDQ